MTVLVNRIIKKWWILFLKLDFERIVASIMVALLLSPGSLALEEDSCTIMRLLRQPAKRPVR